MYYAKVIYTTILMSLKSLAVVQTKPTIKTAKKITHFLNYNVTHPDAITEYRRIRMILHIYSNSSHILEP